VGIGRLSNNWVIAKLATLYVEVTRNLPLLFQLFFWYLAVLAALPNPRNSHSLFDVAFLNVRGLYIPALEFGPGSGTLFAGMVLAIAMVWWIARWGKAKQDATGERPPVLMLSLGVAFGITLIAFIAAGAPVTVDVPEFRTFNYRGGSSVTPEFLALLIGLSIYTGGFIAEIVRPASSAVPWGQTEASLAGFPARAARCGSSSCRRRCASSCRP
jgi:general L-amino acid transport system permease protein